MEFPDYDEYYAWVEAELAGLTDAQLDFDADEPAWMRWSIRLA